MRLKASKGIFSSRTHKRAQTARAALSPRPQPSPLPAGQDFLFCSSAEGQAIGLHLPRDLRCSACRTPQFDRNVSLTDLQVRRSRSYS